MLGTLDGRDKPGQDEVIRPISSLVRPQNFPPTALRGAGEGAERSEAGEGGVLQDPVPGGLTAEQGTALWSAVFALETLDDVRPLVARTSI